MRGEVPVIEGTNKTTVYRVYISNHVYQLFNDKKYQIYVATCNTTVHIYSLITFRAFLFSDTWRVFEKL